MQCQFKMMFKILFFLGWVFPVLTIAQKKTDQDTIRSFHAVIPKDFKVHGVPDPKNDYIEITDSTDSVRLFSIGEMVYLSHFDAGNKHQWPYLNNWIVWPILSLEKFESGADSSSKFYFQADMDFVILSSSKILKIDWIFKSSGGKVTTEKNGQQLWNLKSATCYFDYLVKDSTRRGGAAKNEGCTIKTDIQNDRFIISVNSCSQSPQTGSYKLIGKYLIRQLK